MWVGGDGSTRLYTQQSDTSIWTVANPLTRQDTLEKVSANVWRRHLPNGAFVEFDNTGTHTKTTDMLGRETTFGYAIEGRQVLKTITLPVRSGTAPVYQFYYAIDTDTIPRLQAVFAPNDSGTRTVSVYRAGGRITSMHDPIGVTSFLYDANNQLSARVNKLTDTTSFEFDEARLLKSASLSMKRTDESAPPITQSFCAAESRSLTACNGGTVGTPTPIAKVYTLVDGPRNVGDTTRFFVDRFGAPSTIVDALGHVTSVERNGPFPLLATATVAPNGLRTQVVHNFRGLDSVLTQVNPLGTGQNATTINAWHAQWDMVTATTGPTGERTDISYSTTLPIRLWQQDGRGDSTKVNFDYDAKTQVVKVRQPGAMNDSLEYDDLGNVKRAVSPSGIVADYQRDAIGRVRSVATPITGALHRHQTTTYDAMDRPVTQRDSGATATEHSVLVVTTAFDVEGNPTRVVQEGIPTPAQGTASIRSYHYDPAGRKTAELIGYGLPVISEYLLYSWTYDPAGNIVSGGRDAVGVTLTYDVLNRLIIRNGTNAATYSYNDTTGLLETANNAVARVSRTYHPNGQLKGDTLRIANTDDATPNFNEHVYSLSSTYDLSGRRTQLGHSYNPGSYCANCGETSYAYEIGTGLLESVTDWQGYQYRYAYDAVGRLKTLTSRLGTTGAVVDARGYDIESRLTRRTVAIGANQFRNDTLEYDLRSKIVSANGDLMTYDGRGRTTAGVFGAVEEQMVVDPFGNVVQKTGVRVTPTLVNSQYEPWTGRLEIQKNPGSQGHQDSTRFGYDQFGNLSVTESLVEFAIPNGAGFEDLATHRKVTTDTYDDRNKLVGHQFVYDTVFTSIASPNFDTYQSNLVKYITTSAYRYDALGRRVWARMQRDTLCSRDSSPEKLSGCASTVTRTVWDGDRILAEFQADGRTGANAATLEDDGGGAGYFGGVTYVHGDALDTPLAVYKGGYQVLPVTAWHGQFDKGICGVSVCSQIEFPERHAFGPHHSVPGEWYGSLLGNQLDPSGYVYLRNRYLDPVTGRFTQEDPIGLAGGMNLYGFAGGDPVNFSDPFGLCPDPKDPRCTDVPLVEISTPRNIVKAGAAVASVGMFGRVVSAAIDWAFSKPESSARVDLPGSSKQFGKKYGEHMDSSTPGYRSPQEYRARANEVYNNPNASRTTFPSDAPVYPGETHIRSGNDLLRLDPRGNFRSMYPQ